MNTGGTLFVRAPSSPPRGSPSASRGCSAPAPRPWPPDHVTRHEEAAATFRRWARQLGAEETKHAETPKSKQYQSPETTTTPALSRTTTSSRSKVPKTRNANARTLYILCVTEPPRRMTDPPPERFTYHSIYHFTYHSRTEGISPSLSHLAGLCREGVAFNCGYGRAFVPLERTRERKGCAFALVADNIQSARWWSSFFDALLNLRSPEATDWPPTTARNTF